MGFTELTQDFPEFSSVPQPGADLNYARWQNGNSTIVLHCVPWASTYTDVIGFATDTARDSWFDDATSHERYEIQQAAYIPYGADKCRVQLSSARVAQYNYVEIRTGAAPVQGDAFTGQVPPGPTRAYYFIRSFEQLAPDTCEIRITLDVWTTFIHAFDFGTCWLERGHMGVSVTDADTYLADPSANTSWLLAPDVNFGSADMVSNVETCEMWQGACNVIVGIRADRSWLESAPTLTISGSNAISFYDVTGERWGTDAGCTANVPALLGSVNLPPVTYGPDLQSVRYYVVDNPSTFFASVEQSYAYVYNLIESVYIVPASLVFLGDSFTALGSTMRLIASLPEVTQNIALTKSDFGFDSTVADFAKLYTYPYSVLEYETCDGATHEIRIENTGASLGFASRIAEIDNALQLQTYLNDAGGFGDFEYMWRETSKSLPKGLSQTLHVRGIPAFELIITERAATAAERVRDIAQKCREIETTYTNGARAENTIEQNTLAVNATNYTNALASNATANSNALASNATDQTNAYLSATNTRTNADAAALAEKTNNDASANTTYAITNRTAQVAHDNVTNIAIPKSQTIHVASQNLSVALEGIQRDKVFNDAYADSQLQADMTNANIDSNAAVAGGSIAANTAIGSAGVLTGAATGMGIGSAAAPGLGTVVGAICGAISSAVPVGVASVTTGYNASLLLTKEQTIGQATLNAIAAKQTAADNAIHDMTTANMGYATTAFVNQRDMLSDQADANLLGTQSNATDALTTSLANYANTYGTATGTINPNNETTTKTIADNIKATSDSKANATKTTADTIAANVKTTADSNATNARDAAILNLQDSARTNYAGLTTELETAGLKRHRKITDGSEQEAYNFERAFDTLKIKTQSRDAIMQAGRYFDMYGYAANRSFVPDSSGFALANRTRTYWKFSDVRGCNTSGGNAVRDAVFAILKAGVTVWSSPDVIYGA